MKPKKLFNRNFTLMIIGQIISIFGNVALRFSLSLFILDKTGSAGIFATVLALSTIPVILISPIGGVLAVRVSRQKIMYALDFTTCGIILILSVFVRGANPVAVICAAMVILSIIQCFYQPSVQSSIPLLSSGENLLAANGVVVQVSSVANLIGPILGGFLYGFLGIEPILYICAICFFASAVMELFIKIPFFKQAASKHIFKTIVSDLGEGMSFLKLHNKVLLKALLLLALVNLFISSFIQIGNPVMVKIFLGLSSEMYGFVEAALGIGSILGALCVSFLAPKKHPGKITWFLSLTSLSLIPMVFATFNRNTPYLSYALILVSTLIGMMFAGVFSVYCQALMQRCTPPRLMGKVAAFVTTICMCCFPIGQALYGILFQVLPNKIYFIVMFAVASGIIVSLFGIKTFEWFDTNRPEDFVIGTKFEEEIH
ncbi:MAG: MFS transporter [Oscillospiraceae bacterium]